MGSSACGGPPSRGAAAGRGGALLAALALALLTAAVFRPLAGSGFLNYDDNLYVTENPRVRAGLTGEGIAWAFTEFHSYNWHPLTWVSHMIDVELHGLDPAGHHATSVALHAASAGLLLAVLAAATGAPLRSAAVAALFALHPLHVESVAWVAERKDVLSGLFWALALGAYVRYARRPGRTRYAVALSVFALGLAAKPMLVTLPLVLILADFWPLGRLPAAGGRGADGAGPRAGGRMLLEKAPFFALAALSGVVTILAQRGGGAVRTMAEYPLDVRAANAAHAALAYLAKTLWPLRLSVFYPHPGESLGTLLPLLEGAALAALLAATVVLRRRMPYLLFGWLWYLVTLLPVIGLVQVGPQGMADRYTYIPLTGVFVLAVWAAGDAARRSPAWGRVLPACAAGVLAALALLTRAQLAHWKDSETLFRHALAVDADNFVALTNLAVVHSGRGEYEEAIALYRRAQALDPGNAVIPFNLANRYAETRRPAEAERHYREALRLNPRYPEAHNNLGQVYLGLGRLDEARRHFEAALQIDAGYDRARRNLATVRRRMGAP